MIYQLPNGKIVNMSIDEYLNLTDEDIQYMMSIDFGEYATSPWYGSSISKRRKAIIDDEEEELDTSLDITDDESEQLLGLHIIDESFSDDFIDIPDNLIPD